MKKHLFTIAAVAFALCACQKAETGTNEVAPGANEEVGAPQQILIGTNLKSSELVTKASVDYWNGQTVYVIGYDNAKIGTATEVSEEDGFIMPNISGTTPVKPEDGVGVLEGQLTFTEKFYYDEDVKSYDFVGYYLGEDAEGTPVAGTPAIAGGLLTVPFTIDGTQDVLAATTDRMNAEERKFQDEEGAWKVVKEDYVYSAFAARRHVQPTLKFNHMLTKFSFKVTYGSEDGAQDFKLKKISLGTYKAGALTLNPTGSVPFVASTGSMETVELVPDVTFSAKGDTKEAGCLMVLPGEEKYQMTLVYEQENTDYQEHDYSTPIEIGKVSSWNANVPEDVKTANKFLPGKHYVVNVTVYGLEEIKVDVELIDWENVGDVTIDPDDIPEAIGEYQEVGPTE